MGDKQKGPTYAQVEAAIRKMQQEDPNRFEKLRTGMNKSLDLRHAARNERYMAGMEGPRRITSGSGEVIMDQPAMKQHDTYAHDHAEGSVGAPLDPRNYPSAENDLVAPIMSEIMNIGPDRLQRLIDVANNSPAAVQSMFKVR